jgi:putative ABC transport system ATP-binding protein
MLQLLHVKKTFVEPGGGILPVLDIEHFEVTGGEQLALVGRSGSGKTTLLHVIAGITRPDSGQVMIDGTDVTRLPEAVRDRFRAERIGYVFQTFNLLAGFSALENVLLGMTFARGRSDRGRAIELLGRVGLADRARHKPHALSVGEQQRVAVARALANRPRLMLADEPTANVDSANQDNMIELLRATCAAEEVALVVVTHAPEVAEKFDRVEELTEINQVSAKQIA